MGDLKRRLQDAMIPGDPENSAWVDKFDIEHFDDFITARSNLLLDRIRKVVGESLIVSELSPDMAAEED
jgi:hypothetical protein